MSAVKTSKEFIALIVLASLMAMPVCTLGTNLEDEMNTEIKINLEDVTIAEALNEISKEVDLWITMSDEAEWKLPYGKSTRLSVALKGPASEAVTQMLNEFFMRYAQGQGEIVIYPRPELNHIIGRPSAKQLSLLKDVYTKPIRVYITDNVPETINIALNQEVFISPIDHHRTINRALRKFVGEKSVKIASQENMPIYEEQLPKDANGNEPEEYALPTAITLPQLLRDVKINDREAEWYIPSIDLPNQVPEIRIVESGTLSRLKQNQLIDVSYHDKTPLEILQNLAARGGVNYEKNSHAIQYLEERLTVSMQNVTAMQAMKQIADMAQLIYNTNGSSSFYIEGKVKPPQPKTRAVPTKPRSTSTSTDSGQYV
ncbi:MAG: hypothetical protein ACYSUG_05900 [Planctomycetota bacterium]|jgi:hypothetical protein